MTFAISISCDNLDAELPAMGKVLEYRDILRGVEIFRFKRVKASQYRFIDQMLTVQVVSACDIIVETGLSHRGDN